VVKVNPSKSNGGNIMNTATNNQTWFTVEGGPDHKEYGPFETRAQAGDFADCIGGGFIHEYRNMRLRETREITREEYEAEVKNGLSVLIDPAEYTNT
jgi:hypothetical protein